MLDTPCKLNGTCVLGETGGSKMGGIGISLAGNIAEVDESKASKGVPSAKFSSCSNVLVCSPADSSEEK